MSKNDRRFLPYCKLVCFDVITGCNPLMAVLELIKFWFRCVGSWIGHNMDTYLQLLNDKILSNFEDRKKNCRNPKILDWLGKTEINFKAFLKNNLNRQLQYYAISDPGKIFYLLLLLLISRGPWLVSLINGTWHKLQFIATCKLVLYWRPST